MPGRHLPVIVVTDVTRSVLLVDDNRQFLDAARALLEREGFTVAGVASTTAEALERAGELDLDLALVDVDLGPESGFDLVEQLAELPAARRPAVVLISSYSEEDLADLIVASPAVGFLSKTDLSGAAIRRLLDGSD